MLDIEKIHYIHDLCKPYGEAIDKAKSRMELVKVLEHWEPLAWDALDYARAMSEEEYEDYVGWLTRERKRSKKPEKAYPKKEMDRAAKYGVIVMPETLMEIGLVAARFVVPDGCAFIRLREIGSDKKNHKQLECRIEKGRVKFIRKAAA